MGKETMMQPTTTMVMLPQTEWEGMKSDLKNSRNL